MQVDPSCFVCQSIASCFKDIDRHPTAPDNDFFKKAYTVLKSSFARQQLKTMLIYSGTRDGQGIFGGDTDKIAKMFSDFGMTCTPLHVEEFNPGEWNPKTTALFIPGARSSDLDTHLTPHVEGIREFLHQGGKLFAICGGAYWACRHTDYKLSATEAIQKQRPLNIFPGTGKGPLIFLKKKDPRDATFKHGTVLLEIQQSIRFHVMISGGGSFIPTKDADRRTYSVLAKYVYVDQNEPLQNAIVKCQVGAGRALLSFVHLGYGKKDIEVDAYSQIFPDHPWKDIQKSLVGTKQMRKLAFALQIMELLHDNH